jgi:hypothetical protein
MTTWADFAAAEPQLAERVQAVFAAAKHATMATLRADGSPRISGTEVDFTDGGLHIGIMKDARKAQDLHRDPRYALHSPTIEPDEAGSPWPGDAKIAGYATEVGEAAGFAGSHRFQLDVSEIVLITHGGDPPDHLVIESWHPDRGRQVQDRY